MIKNYADLNFKEEKTGFNAIIMACHLNTEPDALKIIELLISHKYFANQSRIVEINAVDVVGNTALHHAAHTNKLNVVKYLIQ